MITSNVSVICPTNHYSGLLFDINKRSTILIKINNLYEPILLYEDKGNKYFINYRFSLKQSNILDQLKKFLNFIKISYKKNVAL